MAMIGGNLILANATSLAAFIACCCGSPGCPSSCCNCCYRYSVSVSSGSQVYQQDAGNWWKYTWSGASVIVYNTTASCTWDSHLAAMTLTREWSPVGPTGPWFSPTSETAHVEVICGGSPPVWQINLVTETMLFILFLGTKPATTTSCPNGLYNDGSTVSTSGACSTPCCPTDCCDCCSVYSAVCPGGSVCCIGSYGNIFVVSWPQMAAKDVKWMSGCLWYSDYYYDMTYTVKVYQGGTSCDDLGTLINTNTYTNGGYNIQLQCYHGQWALALQWNSLPCGPVGDAFSYKDITPCPNGTYTNSSGSGSVSAPSQCGPVCCPTCVECPGPYTLTLSGLTGVSACKNGVPITLNAVGSPCHWDSGTHVEACASCNGIPGVASWAAGITCSGNPAVFSLTFYGNCMFGSGSWSFALTKTAVSGCPTGTYTDGTVTALVT